VHQAFNHILYQTFVHLNVMSNKEEDTCNRELEDFFDQIDNLKITDDDDDDDDNKEQHDKNNNADHVVVRVDNPTSRQPHEPSLSLATTRTHTFKTKKKSLIGKAESNQMAWQTFNATTLNTSSANATSTSTSSRTTETAEVRKPVSFSLSKKDIKKAKKKKDKKVAQKLLETATVADEDTFKIGSAPRHIIPQELQIPSWILVLDTCALLESYEIIQDIYHCAQDMLDHIQESGIRHDDPMEPIQIVIPYMIWNELDYRTKATALEENDRFKARRAVRMLKELASSPSSSAQSAGLMRGRERRQELQGEDGVFQIFRSQSRIEMDQSRVRHELSSGMSVTSRTDTVEWTNDDYILLCALQQQQRQQRHAGENNSATAFDPSIVLLTLDQVLTGKATSDRVTVMTPKKFWTHHGNRMRSLRERAQLTK
jgi:hypothetical protein